MYHFPFPAKRASEESERTSLVLNGLCKAEAVTGISQPPLFSVELPYSSTEFMIFPVTQQHKGTWMHTQGSPHPPKAGKNLFVKPHHILGQKSRAPKLNTERNHGRGHPMWESRQFGDRNLPWISFKQYQSQEYRGSFRAPSWCWPHPGRTSRGIYCRSDSKDKALAAAPLLGFCKPCFVWKPLTETAATAFSAQPRSLGRNISAASPQWGTVGSGSTHRNCTRTLNSWQKFKLDTESVLSVNSNKDGKSAISYCRFWDDGNTSKWISTQHCTLKP